MLNTLATKALELAAAALGVTEHPHGSNRGPEVDRYLRRVGLDPTKGAYPWCAAFVSCMVLDAAEALTMPRRFRGSASCERLVDLNVLRALAAPADGCIFVHLDVDRKRRHDHCGFLLDAKAGLTLEGNSDAAGSRTGGSVVRHVREPEYMTHWIAIE